MIPRKIILNNIGAVPFANIDLRGVTLAAISGHNGAGKSTAFTWAPLFALFGITKNGCAPDDMVRRGQQEGSVNFEFEHRGDIYQAVRTRSTKGRGKSSLEFLKLSEGQWESHSGTTIRETEEKIKGLLNLDAETFTASSMIIQGKANEFTSQTSGKRKEILQNILGLDIYERLQDQARLKAASINTEFEAVKKQISELEEKLVIKQETQEQLLQKQEELQKLELEIVETEMKRKATSDQIQQLQIKQDKMNDLNQQMDSLTEEINLLQVELNEEQEKLKRAETMLETEERIIQKAQEYEEVRDKVLALVMKEPQLKRFKEEKYLLECDLTKAENHTNELGVRIQSIEKVFENQSELLHAADEYKASLQRLESMDKVHEQHILMDEVVRKARTDWELEVSKNERKKADLLLQKENLKSKTAMMDDANCIDISKAACKFLTDAQAAKIKLGQVENDLMNLDTSHEEALKKSLDEAVEEQRELGYDADTHKELKSKVNDLRLKADEAAQLEGKRELLDNLNDQQTKAIEHEKSLSDKLLITKKDIAAIEEEINLLPAMKERLPKLKLWVDSKNELPVAKETKKTASSRIETIQNQQKDKNLKLNQLTEQKHNLIEEIKDLEFYRRMLETYDNNLTIHRNREKQLHSDIGGLKATMKDLEAIDVKLKKLREESAELSKEWTNWQTLIKAYGRNGIPALIIENAIPELERIANEILGQMTNGEHSLRFDTQRELKSREGVSETLDIIVSDWSGEGPYETFSGGEQLRIDYAIRFALAELLARRAGSKVEWLCIDEGLGSQDEEHRVLVVEAIKRVADRFRMVTVITHIGEAQAMFDQIIRFEPNDDHVDVQVA